MSVEVPKFIRAMYGSAHAFRSEKRSQLRTLERAYKDLRGGCAFFPGRDGVMSGIESAIAELKKSLSVKTWGR